MRTATVFIADDNTQFDTESACLQHDADLRVAEIVTNVGVGLSRATALVLVQRLRRDGCVIVNNEALDQLMQAARKTIDFADNTGCDDDLTVTSDSAIERMGVALHRLTP